MCDQFTETGTAILIVVLLSTYLVLITVNSTYYDIKLIFTNNGDSLLKRKLVYSLLLLGDISIVINNHQVYEG